MYVYLDQLDHPKIFADHFRLCFQLHFFINNNKTRKQGTPQSYPIFSHRLPQGFWKKFELPPTLDFQPLCINAFRLQGATRGPLTPPTLTIGTGCTQQPEVLGALARILTEESVTALAHQTSRIMKLRSIQVDIETFKLLIVIKGTPNIRNYEVAINSGRY